MRALFLGLLSDSEENFFTAKGIFTNSPKGASNMIHMLDSVVCSH